jgi:SAM-dependent methyltransferase
VDRFDLYELCTQTPELDVALLRAIHGGAPRVVGEDFAGTAALSREWVRSVRGGRAIAVDRDPEPLARAQGVAGVECVVADVRRVARRVDLLVALNFSWCMLHERRDLVAYLRRARRRLTRGGCFVADLYGGDGAFMQGKLREERRGPDGEKIVYEFEQREADALTGRVVDALHFDVTPRGGAPGTPRARRLRLRDAFVYDWRLWSIPELRDALHDAGFARSEVHSRFEHARSGGGGRVARVHVRPLATSQQLGRSWCVFVVGRR